MAHEITLRGYKATFPQKSKSDTILQLGTKDSYGIEQLQITKGTGWSGLTVLVTFNPPNGKDPVSVTVPESGLIDVPAEATAVDTRGRPGAIVFSGTSDGVQRITTNLYYTVLPHDFVEGSEPAETPSVWEDFVNQTKDNAAAAQQAAADAKQAADDASKSEKNAAASAEIAQTNANTAKTYSASAVSASSQATAQAAVASNAAKAAEDTKNALADAVATAGGTVIDKTFTIDGAAADAKAAGEMFAKLAPISAAIRPTVTGNPAVCENSAAWAFQGLKIYGKSTQDGTPSPESPVPIVSAGDAGNISINLSGTNLMNYFLIPEYGDYARCKILLDGNIFSFTTTADGDAFFGGYVSIGIGKIYPSSERILLFPVTPGEKLKIIASNPYFKTKYFCFVAKDFTVVSYVKGSSATVPEGAAFATARLGNSSAKVSDGTQYTTFMVCPEEYTGNFVPYQGAQSSAVSTPSGLPGIPVESGGNYTDSTGQQWICDEINFSKWKMITRIQSVTITPASNLYTATGKDLLSFALKLPSLAFNTSEDVVQTNYFCDTYRISKNVLVGSPENEATGIYNQNQMSTLFINDRRFSTVEEYKTWLTNNPVTILYALASPIESDITAEEMASYRTLTTYDGTTVVSTAEPVAGIEASYVMDGNKYRESVDKRLAALEAAQTGI